MLELVSQQNHRLALLTGRLQTLSPLAVLSRGYAIIKRGETKEVIHTSEQLKKGDQLQIEFADGEVAVVVTQIDRKGEK